jgi:hypothetical protein
MTQSSGGYPTPAASTSQPATTVAKDEAAGVAESAKEAGGHVAQTAADQAREVAAETSRQARDLMREGRHQIREQARTGQHQAAEGLNAIADQLREMATNSSQSGIATDVVRQASDRLHDVAAWLSKREPGDLVNEVRSWARQHPGAFLFGAAVAGVVAGRLTSGAVAAARESSSGQATTGEYTDQSYTGQDYTSQQYTNQDYTGLTETDRLPAAGDPYYAGQQTAVPAEPLPYGAGTTPTQSGGPPTTPPYQGTGTGEPYQERYQDPYQDPYRQQGGQAT